MLLLCKIEYQIDVGIAPAMSPFRCIQRINSSGTSSATRPGAAATVTVSYTERPMMSFKSSSSVTVTWQGESA